MAFGFKDNKCKQDVYTANEVDAKLSNKSDTSHTHDGRYYTETEIDTKLATYKLKGDFVVLTGEKTLDAATTAGEYTQTLWSVNYPSGFNKSNTIVLAYQGTLYTGDTATIGALGVGVMVSGASFRSTIPRSVNLTNDNISLEAFNASDSSRTYYYTLVLMKV